MRRRVQPDINQIEKPRSEKEEQVVLDRPQDNRKTVTMQRIKGEANWRPEKQGARTSSTGCWHDDNYAARHARNRGDVRHRRQGTRL